MDITSSFLTGIVIGACLYHLYLETVGSSAENKLKAIEEHNKEIISCLHKLQGTDKDSPERAEAIDELRKLIN